MVNIIEKCVTLLYALYFSLCKIHVTYILDAPVCKHTDPKAYGVARTEVVNVTCEVEADPPEVHFRWSLNNTLETVSLPTGWSEGSRSVLSYTPKTLAGYGLLLCWGSNSIGGQREPCVAKIIPAGNYILKILW